MGEIKYASKNNGKYRQFTAAVIVNLAAISYGITCGWPSPMIPVLRRENNPISDLPLNEEGASWIAGLLCLGALFSTPFLGNLIEKIGRKRFGYVTFLPMIIVWIISIFATNYTWLYVARFISGIAGAMGLFLVPIYVSEIASEDIRGALGSLLVLAINIGILLAFVAGTIMPYVIFNTFSIIFPIFFVGAFIFLPETPVYLVRRNRISEAIRSLMYFSGNNKVLVDLEICRLQAQVKSTTNAKHELGLRNIFKDRATRKGMIISLGLLGGQQLGGIFAMVNYAETIFKMSGSSLSPATAAITIGTIQVFGSYLSTVLMERVGRRPLVLISCAGMCACHYIVGIFCILQEKGFEVSNLSFAPIISLSAYMITYCLGMGPVPFVVASEIFKVDISSSANTICFVFLWIMAFTVLKSFSFMMELIGIGGCFLIFGTSCAFFFFFAYNLLLETKGRKREDIVDELARINQISSCSQEVYISDGGTVNKNFITSEQI